MVEPAKLRRSDYMILAAFASVAVIILYNAIGGVLEAPRDESVHPGVTERPEHSIAVLPFVNISNDPD